MAPLGSLPRYACRLTLIFTPVKYPNLHNAPSLPIDNLPLYTVPSTSEILVLSSFIPKYTIHNTYLNTSTTLTTLNYDPTSVLNASTNGTVPPGASAYVKSVTINGVTQPGRCAFDFYDTFRVGGEIVVELTGEKGEAEGCDATGGGGGNGTGNGTGTGGVPQSLSGGGFASVR